MLNLVKRSAHISWFIFPDKSIKTVQTYAKCFCSSRHTLTVWSTKRNWSGNRLGVVSEIPIWRQDRQFCLEVIQIQTIKHFLEFKVIYIYIHTQQADQTYIKRLIEKSRMCHSHKPQPNPDTKRKKLARIKQTNKCTRSTQSSSLFPKRGVTFKLPYCF